MTEPREFWLAKGACAQCAGPVARRAAGPGPQDVACNRCHATTRLPATRMVQHEGRPPVPAPDAPLPPTPPAPASPQKASRVLLPILAGVLLLVGGAAALWLLLPGEEPPAWQVLDETLVPEFGEREVRFHVDVVGRDAAGNLLPRDRLSGVPDWYFANGTTRAPTPEGLAWTACNPLDCTYAVPAGSVLYYNSFHPEARGTGAFDTGARNLSTYFFGGWGDVPDWEEYFGSHKIVRATPLRAGEDGAWHLMLFSNASNEQDVRLNVSILQGGVVVESGLIETSSPFGSPWKTPEFSARVQKGSVEVRVMDEAGAILATTTVTPSDCPKVELQVDVAISETGVVTLDQVRCV